MIRTINAAILAVLAFSWVVGVAGCMHHDAPPKMPPNTMTNDDMIKKANQMIADGKQMQSTSAAMAEGEKRMGMTKDEMKKKGQKMIDEGQEMKTKAMSQQM